MTQASTHRSPESRGQLNKRPAADDVIVRDGTILCWFDGIFGPTAPATVWGAWLGLASSPFPASRSRAAALRSALDKIGYLQ